MSPRTLDRAALVSRVLFPARARGALPPGWKLAAVRTVVDGPELDLEFLRGVERARITLSPGVEGPANLRSARFRLSLVGEAGRGAGALSKAVHWLVCRHEGRLSDDQWALIRGGYAVVGDTLFARLTLKCNERCVFCFADEEAAENTADLIRDIGHLRACLAAFPRLGVRELLLTGGEPTLVPELPELLAEARAAGFRAVTLETNARRFADPAFAARCAGRAPGRAFVSLYAVTPEVARAVGRVAAPLEERLAGVQALLDLGVAVEMNLVLARPNLGEALPVVEVVAERFQGRVRALSFSGVAPFGLAWRDRAAIIPRLSEVAPVLRAALTRALELGLTPSVPAGCSLPRCLAPEHSALFREGAPGDPSACQGKSQPPTCAPCRFAPTCPGVWDRYQELHGSAGLMPVH